LDAVRLTMDVVDTLRHRERLVEQELAGGEREEQLFERLRQIYASQGIEVTDRILQEGVDALREGRFVYTPPAREPVWAKVYINRGRWGKGLLALVVVGVLAFFAYDALVRAPQRTLVSDLSITHAEVVTLS